MSHIGVGISAIRAAQVGLNTAAHNIANASTEGYHRQNVHLAAQETVQRYGNGLYEGGVFVSRIERLRSATVEQAITANISGQESASAQLTTLQQIESALTPGDGSIHSLVTQFFNEVNLLASSPSEPVLREQVTATASQLAESINGLSGSFDGLGGASEEDITTAVNAANELAVQISDANRQIRIAESSGQSTNQLADARDLLINELALWVDISPESHLNGADPLIAAGGALIIGETTTQITIAESSDGRLLLNSSTGQTNIPVESGRLAGFIESARAIDSGIGAEFADWARTLLQEIDTIHATGISLNGPSTAIHGTRSLGDVDAPLSTVQSLYGIETGQISLSVTGPDGQRATTFIEVDAEVDSLRDVVDRIDAVAGIDAAISESGTVSIIAEPGYGIDFAGRPDQAPEITTFVGTSEVSVDGAFQGDSNKNWDFEVITGGRIGIDENVSIRVTDRESGQVINTLQVGLGYAANELIDVADGIQVSFTPGALFLADEFSINATGQPDTTNLLANLGLGTLFTGNSLGQLSLAPALNDADNLATSQLGTVGDGGQLSRLIALRDQPLFSASGETLEERLATLTGLSGTLSAGRQSEIDQRSVRNEELLTQRDSVSGVDPNEEFLEMLQYQRAFQAASRFVTMIDETLDDLLQTIGR